MFAKVKDHENLVRDMNSKAILNTDKLALQEYYQKREMAKKELLKQANFARLVNQSPVRIYYLIETRRLPVTTIDGVNFIEASEENINIAKRKTK